VLRNLNFEINYFTGMEKKLEEKEDMYFFVYPSYSSK
jgi:hypothetical protein